MRILTFFILFFYTNIVFSATRIEVNKGNIDPINIGLTHSLNVSSLELSIFEDMRKVIVNNLHSTGLLRVISEDSYLDKIDSIESTPNFELWKNINASFLSNNHLLVKDGKIHFTLKLWDSFSTKLASGKTYVADKSQWRKLAHMISDEIYTKLTGEYPYFNTQICYINELNTGQRKIKKLAIMDQDGENNFYLTNGDYIVLTPRFSPDAKKILYMSYKNDLARVHLRDLVSGSDRIIGNFPGMSFAPRFSPDGGKAVLSVTNRGASNIYLLDLQRLTQKKLTNDNAIDTSPSFSPDGKNIVFTSDRNGSPKLYIMNVADGSVKQISTGQGVYTTPVWSPREDLIAFTRNFQGKFYIGVIRPDGTGERLITEGYMVEGPAWAPNGRVIIFTKSTKDKTNRWGDSNLFSIDITGFNERKLNVENGSSGANWSNVLN